MFPCFDASGFSLDAEPVLADVAPSADYEPIRDDGGVIHVWPVGPHNVPLLIADGITVIHVVQDVADAECGRRFAYDAR